MNSLLDSLRSKNADIRQASAYCLGIAAVTGGPTYHDYCTRGLSLLAAVIMSPEARSEEYVVATENAISAVGKICRYVGSTGAFDLEQALGHWVQQLPVLHDEEEAEPTYEYLLELIERYVSLFSNIII
jgi:importin-5